MKPTVTYPDVEQAVVDLLTSLVASKEPAVTVGVGVPSGWRPSSPAHLEVALDGTPLEDHPVAIHATIRIVARAASTSEAKRLATLAFGLLCAHTGEGALSRIAPMTGPLPARDPDSQAELAAVTVRATARSKPL